MAIKADETPITPPPAVDEQQYLYEVFCADLPSPCNIYLSGKRCLSRQPTVHTSTINTSHSVVVEPIIRFATEGHSVAILQTNGTNSTGSESIQGGDGYHLSATRLKNQTDDNVDVCLAHSAVSWMHDANSQESSSSMEVFAMMSINSDTENINDNNAAAIDSSSSCLTTTADDIGTSDLAAGVGEQPTAGAATVPATETKSTEAGEVSNQSTKANKETAAADSEGVSSSNYYLTVKIRVIAKNDDRQLARRKEEPRMISTIETIPLDFRPLSVHSTELHNGGDNTTLIGIFVSSVDDNKLRLYVATKGALQHQQNAFVPISLDDTVSNSDDHADDATDDDSIALFSTPIMAIDTCITRVKCIDDKVNRLALACYDGTVRILTYQLIPKKQEDGGSSEHSESFLQFCHVRCSTFLIDGPVVSLNFGMNRPSNPKLLHPPSLYLIAGSLCGFACTFYESTLPCDSSSENNDTFFSGPLPVVDGLYDATEDGDEDSVTAVHTFCHSKDQNMVVVGTQGGRIILFRQCQKEKDAWEDRVEFAKQQKDGLILKIEQSKREISRLQSEKELMESNAVDLNAIISELQSKIEDDLKEKQDGTDVIDTELKNEDCKEESTETVTVEGEVDANTATNDEEVDTNEDVRMMSNESCNVQTKLEVAQSELESLQHKIKDHVSQMASLSSDVDDCIRSEEYTRKLNEYIIHPGMHRYRFLCEHHLPCPIHGLTSMNGDETGEGQEIAVTTRRSIHIFSIPSLNND